MSSESLRSRARRVLSINQRNLSYVYPSNPRRHFPLADDKLKTKQLMAGAGVPVPRTYRTYAYFYQLRELERELGEYPEFVIKPAMGRAGGGILVVTGRDGPLWRTAGGGRHSAADLRKQLADIIFGVYSFDLQDTAVVEERIRQHPEMAALAPAGLADVRVVLYRDRPVMAMTRLPTEGSAGRANLHQGAVGVGIDLETGQTVCAVSARRPVERHPDSGRALVGCTIPHWPGVMDLARRAAAALPLKYLGVDVAISEDGPVLLEVNVRPGLEIQNANRCGLRPPLEAVWRVG